MSNSILDKISGLTSASTVEAKVKMTEPQRKNLMEKLKADNRMNVYPNQFDVKTPFRVQVRKGGEWTTHGYFTNVDVAAAVGTICSAAAFGAKALAGNYDREVVESHPEFAAWLADERNTEVLAAVGMS